MENNNNNEIVPGKGYNNFIFGMDYAKVIELTGDPDEIIKNDENEDGEFADSLTAFFDDHGLAMFFEQIEKDGPLTLQSIEVDEPTALMYGKSIFGMDKDKLIALIEKETGEKAVVDKDEDFDDFDLVDFEKSGISLQIENEELVSVTLYNMA